MAAITTVLVNDYEVKAGVVCLQCESCVILTWALQRWASHNWELYKCLSLPLHFTLSVCDCDDRIQVSDSNDVNNEGLDTRQFCVWRRNMTASFTPIPTIFIILTFRCLRGSAPSYLANSLRRTVDVAGRQRLRSSDVTTLAVPSTRR